VAEFVCGVRETNSNYLSACKNLPEYQETSYCVLHFPGEEKEDFEQVKKDKLEREDYDFSGTVFPEGTSDFSRFVFDGNADFTGATFIGEAGFSGAQFSGEANFYDAQFSGERTYFVEAQFSGERTYFQGAHFSGKSTSFQGAQFSGEWTIFRVAQFSGERTYFSEAQFSGERTSFEGAQFSGKSTSFEGAQFSGEWTYFSEARFSGERTSFVEAQFSGERTSFLRAEFSAAETSFLRAQFGSAETSFQEATFAKEVYFSGVTFSEKVIFWGTQGNPVFGPGAWAQFDRPRIEKPEQFTFNTVLLHPGWFINADVRKVDFTDVKWYGMPGGPEGKIEAEVKALAERGVESPYTLLSQACRRLSANAEENREYPLANEFYYWSMNALRKEGWRSLGAIGTLYWALSGYGVRATRAFLVLVGICAAFAALYMVFGPPKLEDLGQALVYSLGAVARLNPEPRPTEPGVFQFLVIVEGLLGPLQIALLALAVRRKVMR
jgi:uncharacterized protein YjbI with pentapeptide repeats